MKADSSYSTVYRIMHWSIAFCFIFLLLTIFLRLGWMNKNHMAGIMGDYLRENGVTLSEDQLVDMAKKVRKPMWIWHTYIGYVLVVLYSIRLLLPFIGEMKIRSPFTSGLSVKDKFRFWTYILFHILVVVSLTTGLLIVWGPDNLHETAEEIHVLSLYYLLTFIVLHFGGVLIAEFGNDKGIISRIVR